jgi:hypothetical protein
MHKIVVMDESLHRLKIIIEMTPGRYFGRKSTKIKEDLIEKVPMKSTNQRLLPAWNVTQEREVLENHAQIEKFASVKIAALDASKSAIK